MTVLLSLLAAASFALGIVFQQRGTMETEAGEGDLRFLAQVFRQPIWFIGALLSALGWVLQTAALKDGQLVVVQGLVTLSLVMTVPFGAWFNHQKVDHKEFTAAITTVVGLLMFLVVGKPSGGIDQPAAGKWWAAAAIAVVAVGIMGWLGLRRHGPPAAAMLGCAAGVAFGFQASVSKMFANELGGGLAALLSSWSTWALVASALIGFAMQQSALKVGALAAAVAATNSATLLVSVVLGVVLFEEKLGTGGTHRVFALIGLVLTIGGIGTLAGVRGTESSVETTASTA
jgi:hypothetical protein